MEKYTFICDYKRGTYISQYIAENINEAMNIWAHSLDSRYFTEKEINKIQNSIQEEINAPIPLERVENVWCSSFSVYKSLLLLNIVKTV